MVHWAMTSSASSSLSWTIKGGESGLVGAFEQKYPAKPDASLQNVVDGPGTVKLTSLETSYLAWANLLLTPPFAVLIASLLPFLTDFITADADFWRSF